MWAGQLVLPTVLFATPLLVAALGELVVERAGVINIGIEGMMLAGALGAWAANAAWGPAAGFAGAVVFAEVLALVFAAVVLVFKADQIVTGTGINLLSLGVTGVLFRRMEGILAGRELHAVSELAMAGLVPLLAAGLWGFFRFTRGGMELAAIGEAPHAADTAGVAVGRRQLYAILFGAACAGLAGAYLSTMRTTIFQENMTEGQGFLALALVIFGRWSAVGIVLAGLFFGLVRAYAERLVVHGQFPAQYSELVKMLPYVVSLMALAGVAARSASPEGLGKAYARE